MKIDNFIGIWEDAFTPEFCNEVVEYFKTMKEAGFVDRRIDIEKSHRAQKDDEIVFMHQQLTVSLVSTQNIANKINSTLWEKCYAEYAKEFSVLKDFPPHSSTFAKLQKTKIGGGYHVWHAENAAPAVTNRILVWMAYLNDVEEGGETEFLYLHKRIKPKAGTMLIWPAGFTHTHRGNPPLSNSKYIITGWIHF